MSKKRQSIAQQQTGPLGGAPPMGMHAAKTRAEMTTVRYEMDMTPRRVVANVRINEPAGVVPFILMVAAKENVELWCVYATGGAEVRIYEEVGEKDDTDMMYEQLGRMLTRLRDCVARFNKKGGVV